MYNSYFLRAILTRVSKYVELKSLRCPKQIGIKVRMRRQLMDGFLMMEVLVALCMTLCLAVTVILYHVRVIEQQQYMRHHAQALICVDEEMEWCIHRPDHTSLHDTCAITIEQYAPSFLVKEPWIIPAASDRYTVTKKWHAVLQERSITLVSVKERRR